MAVVIIAHNSEKDLKGCLKALANDEEGGSVVVMDNASTDDSVAVARMAGGDWVEVVALDENTGFAGGCNRGYGKVRGEAEYVAFMNPDVRIEQGCFERGGQPAQGNLGAGVEPPGWSNGRRRKVGS